MPKVMGLIPRNALTDKKTTLNAMLVTLDKSVFQVPECKSDILFSK